MDDKELIERLHRWADDAAASKRGGEATMREAATRLAALAVQVKELTEDRDARRTSLEQEIRETLRVRGHWSGNADSSSVITAVGQALDKLAGEVERMRSALAAIRAHHVDLNTRQGRPLTRSKTITLCDLGLGDSEVPR